MHRLEEGSMRCPVCGGDCIQQAGDILDTIPAIFSPCPDCMGNPIDKRLPPPVLFAGSPCTCGKRFIDIVCTDVYRIMQEDGLLRATDPLGSIGTPMVHPGFAMRIPPFLPKSSLVLLSPIVTNDTAVRLAREVPEIRGVVKTGSFIPGITEVRQGCVPAVYELLAGCDVRADVFPTRAGPLVLYKQQSLSHIEFPRRYNPKIASVESVVTRSRPSWFVDACSGIGTLGLTGARMKIPHVILNDAWYAASFWAAYNLAVNAEFFDIRGVSFLQEMDSLKQRPVGVEPIRVAETVGKQEIVVYHGDLLQLYQVLPDVPVLTVIDLFEKENLTAVSSITAQWRSLVSGEVFIP